MILAGPCACFDVGAQHPRAYWRELIESARQGTLDPRWWGWLWNEVNADPALSDDAAKRAALARRIEAMQPDWEHGRRLGSARRRHGRRGGVAAGGEGQHHMKIDIDLRMLMRCPACGRERRCFYAIDGQIEITDMPDLNWATDCEDDCLEVMRPAQSEPDAWIEGVGWMKLSEALRRVAEGRQS